MYLHVVRVQPNLKSKVGQKFIYVRKYKLREFPIFSKEELSVLDIFVETASKFGWVFRMATVD